MYLNTYECIGNLVRDPELKMVNAGNKQVAVVRFTLANNRSYKDKSGNYQEDTDWIPCEAWDTGAEKIQSLFSKGDAMFIQGSLRSDQWEDKKTGEKRSALKVRVERFMKIPREPRGAKNDEGGPTSASVDVDLQDTDVL